MSCRIECVKFWKGFCFINIFLEIYRRTPQIFSLFCLPSIPIQQWIFSFHKMRRTNVQRGVSNWVQMNSLSAYVYKLFQCFLKIDKKSIGNMYVLAYTSMNMCLFACMMQENLKTRSYEAQFSRDVCGFNNGHISICITFLKSLVNFVW